MSELPHEAENLRWALIHLDDSNGRLIDAANAIPRHLDPSEDSKQELWNCFCDFRDSLRNVEAAVTTMSPEQRQRLESATSPGWFDRLSVQRMKLSEWCRNALRHREPADGIRTLCLALTNHPRPSHSRDQIDSFRRMCGEIVSAFQTQDASGLPIREPKKTGTPKTAKPRQKRMSINVANETLKALLENGPEQYLEMTQKQLAKAIGCSRGTLGKTSAYRNTIPKLQQECRRKRR